MLFKNFLSNCFFPVSNIDYGALASLEIILLGKVMDKVADEIRGYSSITYRQIEESVTRRTTSTSFKHSICSDFISSSLSRFVIKCSDCGLRTLRTRLKVLSVFTLPVLKIVDTLDKCFVALLKAHHELT